MCLQPNKLSYYHRITPRYKHCFGFFSLSKATFRFCLPCLLLYPQNLAQVFTQ